MSKKHKFAFTMTHKVIVVGALLGALFFFLFYGAAVLNPSNVDWIKASTSDLSQHYIGWLFYRTSDVPFPLGAISGLAYPNGLSLTYMDSIPLFAIPFKLFASVLPETFQYFGIWGLVSYILTGVIAGLIILKLTRTVWISILGSVLLILSPLILDRMFGHTALAGQWVVLLGILILFVSKTLRIRHFVLAWSGVMVLSVLIHPYFLPMNGVLFALALIATWSGLKNGFVKAVPPVLMTVITFWLIGGFSIGGSYANDGLDKYTVNANAAYNPMGWSAFIPSQPTHVGSYEGFAYLGLGVLVLGATALIMILAGVRRSTMRRQYGKIVAALRRPKVIFSMLLLAALFFAALGTVIHIGSLSIPLPVPAFIEKVWSIFRASGRLIWPLYYLAVIVLVIFVYKRMDKKIPRAALAIFFVGIVGLQAVDVLVSPRATEKSAVLKGAATAVYTPTYSKEEWGKLLEGKNHIQLMEQPSSTDFFELAYLAAARHITISDGYFARSPARAIAAQRDASYREIVDGSLRSDTVYLTKNQELTITAKDQGMIVHLVSGYMVITK